MFDIHLITSMCSVCVYVGEEEEEGMLFTALLSAESVWTAWVWIPHFFLFSASFHLYPFENMIVCFVVVFLHSFPEVS